MTRISRQFTGLGASLALIATLLASGCGQAPRGVAPGMRADMMQARSGGYAVRFNARPKVRNLREPLPGTTMHGLEDDEKPADPPAAGGRPVAKPTPTPPPKAPGEPAAPGEVDRLLTDLQNYGYSGNRKQMVRALQAKLFGYPVNTPDTPGGWDKSVDPREHYEWWKRTLSPGETGSYNEYLTQSLQIAQNKFDVVYYVWVSKQKDPANNKPQKEPPWNNTAPFVNLDDEIPVVKAIDGGGWLVEISDHATILDYLKIPERYLRDYNHLIPIPEELYY